MIESKGDVEHTTAVFNLEEWIGMQRMGMSDR